MAFKIVTFVCMLSVAYGGVLPTYIPPVQHYLPPATTTQAPWKPEPIVWKPEPVAWKPAPERPANYEFKYEVNDPTTGDIKQQFEKAENGVISGQYWLIEPDGSKRIVDYTADDKNGFQATVRKEPAAGWKPEIAPWKPEVPKPEHKPWKPEVPKPEHKPWVQGYYY